MPVCLPCKSPSIERRIVILAYGWRGIDQIPGERAEIRTIIVAQTLAPNPNPILKFPRRSWACSPPGATSAAWTSSSWSSAWRSVTSCTRNSRLMAPQMPLMTGHAECPALTAAPDRKRLLCARAPLKPPVVWWVQSLRAWLELPHTVTVIDLGRQPHMHASAPDHGTKQQALERLIAAASGQERQICQR